ncbi:hypothetical protein E3T55_16765 [Cryobacterium frigoriphilum]|uniref:Uncharacterized protein n=1 Tax=Cryobacterium frigoriphilum TaxID=1259150 RepID=A0A4R8ZUZ1_9MICO|nr:hypothetical protein [Cryobacterium frigoriphilum]TFD46786.1 hypothetical protein E3T55_16765 [Cryobacterium frigoriphilum]
MNKYALIAEDHWKTAAPSRYAALPNPAQYFEELGEQVLSQVDDLSQRIAGPDPVGERYLEKVGRLTMAQKQAEEIVLADLVWITTPELSADEERDEWETTRPMDSALARWAESVQDSPDGVTSTDEEERMAAEWAVPVSFIQELLAAESPSRFLTAHTDTMKRVADIRYQQTTETHPE